MSTLTDKLLIYAKNNLNVLFVGRHGIGKTTVVQDVCKTLKERFKYFSTPTLDPYSELIGIPVPDPVTKTINFFRSKDLYEAEFIFFDELNRAQNERILNSVLEIIQFKSINGEKLPNLKRVWASINPPGDYQVIELDPALEDRFHIYIRMQAEVSLEYMKTKMSEGVAKAVKEWWDHDLGDEHKKIFTPRRCEYLGIMIENEIPWRDCMPLGTIFPVPSLEARLKQFSSGKVEFIVSKENVLQDIAGCCERLKKQKQLAIPVCDLLCNSFDEEELFKCRDIIEILPSELISKIIDGKWPPRQGDIVKFFVTNKIDLKRLYPRMFAAFDEQAFEETEWAT